MFVFAPRPVLRSLPVGPRPFPIPPPRFVALMRALQCSCERFAFLSTQLLQTSMSALLQLFPNGLLALRCDTSFCLACPPALWAPQFCHGSGPSSTFLARVQVLLCAFSQFPSASSSLSVPLRCEQQVVSRRFLFSFSVS